MMMSDPALQHLTADAMNQPIVTQHERQTLLQKLTAKWTPEISKRLEGLAFEKSGGVKAVYWKFIQGYYRQVQDAYHNRANQQQAAVAPPVNSNPPRFPPTPQASPMLSATQPRSREPQQLFGPFASVNLSQSYPHTPPPPPQFGTGPSSYPIHSPVRASTYANHSNDVLHQYVVGGPVASPTPGGDRLLQQILSNGNKGLSHSASRPMPPQPSPTPVMMHTPPSRPPISPMASPLKSNIQVSTSPVNRSLPPAGTGSIVNPDDDTLGLIKYLKDNIGKLQFFAQKFFSDGNARRARDIQMSHQQTVQFISNPTYEGLVQAKQIRQVLEQAQNRSQAAKNESSPADFSQFEKALTEFLSADQKKRSIVSKMFIEPLSDVLNGVPHKRIRLDSDQDCRPMPSRPKPVPLSLFSRLNVELNNLPSGIFSIATSPSRSEDQIDDELLNKTGVVLRCQLFEHSYPLIPMLRLRVSTRYPDDPPEVLSLLNSHPPRLEFTEGHPFFEQLSTNFVSYLFQLPRQHTITDLLTIWRQSVPTTPM